MTISPSIIDAQRKKCGLKPLKKSARGRAPAACGKESAGGSGTPAFKSNLEREYFDLLTLQARTGIIRLFSFESLKIRIAHRCWYTPDFVVDNSGNGGGTAAEGGDNHPGAVTAIEVKGPYAREDSIIKFKAASAAAPWLLFLMVTKKDGQWVTIRSMRGGRNINLTGGLDASGA